MKNQKGFVPILILIIVLLTGIGYFAYQNMQMKKSATQDQPTPPATTYTPYPSPTVDPTENWKIFSIPEVNISFKLPPTLEKGDKLVREMDQGETGNEIRYHFLSDTPARNSYQSNFSIKLVSSDFAAGRDFNFFDLNGYAKTKNGYQYLSYAQHQSDLPTNLVQEKTNPNGVKYLVIQGRDELIDRGGDMVNYPINGTPGEGNIGAIINTSDNQYPGIIIFAKLTKTLTKETFDQILSTFRFLELPRGEIKELSKCVPTTESGNPKCYSQTTQEACSKFASECRWAIALP